MPCCAILCTQDDFCAPACEEGHIEDGAPCRRHPAALQQAQEVQEVDPVYLQTSFLYPPLASIKSEVLGVAKRMCTRRMPALRSSLPCNLHIDLLRLTCRLHAANGAKLTQYTFYLAR